MTNGTKPRGERLFHNVLWNWVGITAALFSGFVLSPLIIRRLGTDGYGMWALVFSLVEYYWLLDFGFRSAVVKLTAHYNALNDADRINLVLNTSLAYFAGAAVVLIVITLFAGRYAPHVFKVADAYRDTFRTLILIIGIGWSFGMMFLPFTASLEGFQLFHLTSRISVASIVLRSIGVFAVLSLGYGAIAMGVVVLGAQTVLYVLSFMAFRSAFPQLRLGPSLITRQMCREIGDYAKHSFVASTANLISLQSAPVVIGLFRPAAQVGYYNITNRVLISTLTMPIAQVGQVTSADSAALAAHGDLPATRRLGIYANRYSLLFFLAPALMMFVYGRNLLDTWIGPDFAANAAPLIPVTLLGFGAGIAAQQSSSAILMGLGKHQEYAIALMVEAVSATIMMIIVVPHFGVLGAVLCGSLAMAVNRGLVTPWLFCHHTGGGFGNYMRDIYQRPVLIAVPVWLLLTVLHKTWLPGRGWRQLIAAAGISSVTYAVPAFLWGVDRSHRQQLFRMANKWARQVRDVRRIRPSMNL